MRLWTIQNKAAYEVICQKGVLRCDPTLAEWLDENSFRRSYDWLVSEMKEQIGEPPIGIEYPIWAWYHLYGHNKKPDLRRYEFRNYAGEHYIIEAEMPDEMVLLSDEEYWHFVLNDVFFSDASEDNAEAIDIANRWFDGLPLQEQGQVKRESWRKIFDKTCCPWNFVQATFWELRKEQIVSVRKFFGKAKPIESSLTTI